MIILQYLCPVALEPQVGHFINRNTAAVAKSVAGFFCFFFVQQWTQRRRADWSFSYRALVAIQIDPSPSRTEELS